MPARRPRTRVPKELDVPAAVLRSAALESRHADLARHRTGPMKTQSRVASITYSGRCSRKRRTGYPSPARTRTRSTSATLQACAGAPTGRNGGSGSKHSGN